MSRRRLAGLPWLAGSADELARGEAGEAGQLHCSAVTCEREGKYHEARDLHQKAAAASGSGAEGWAAESRRRLEEMPWLREPDLALACDLAVEALESDQLEEALSQCEEAKKHNPTEGAKLASSLSRSLREKAGSSSRAGKHRDAVRYSTHAVRLQPDSALAHGNLGWHLYLVGRYGEAMAASLRALELRPNLPWVQANIGLLHIRDHDLARAMERYGRVPKVKRYLGPSITDLVDLVKEDGFPEAHYALGYLHERGGESPTAAEHYRKYVDLVKSGEFVERAGERLAALVKD